MGLFSHSRSTGKPCRECQGCLGAGSGCGWAGVNVVQGSPWLLSLNQSSQCSSGRECGRGQGWDKWLKWTSSSSDPEPAVPFLSSRPALRLCCPGSSWTCAQRKQLVSEILLSSACTPSFPLLLNCPYLKTAAFPVSAVPLLSPPCWWEHTSCWGGSVPAGIQAQRCFSPSPGP